MSNHLDAIKLFTGLLNKNLLIYRTKFNILAINFFA